MGSQESMNANFVFICSRSNLLIQPKFVLQWIWMSTNAKQTTQRLIEAYPWIVYLFCLCEQCLFVADMLLHEKTFLIPVLPCFVQVGLRHSQLVLCGHQ